MKQKHVPQRTCLGCRQVRAKRSMIRVVRTPDRGVVVDPTGKLAGRGAYLCNQVSCWEAALAHGALERGLETTLTAEEKATLRQVAAGLALGSNEQLDYPRSEGTSGVPGLRA